MTELVKTSGIEVATVTTAQEEVAPDSVTVMPKGERVVVKRTNGALEYNWHVVGVDTRIDRETGASVEYRIVQTTENDKVLTKALKLTELLAIKEKLDDKFKRDMGEPAIIGAAADGVIDLGHIEAVRVKDGEPIEPVVEAEDRYDHLFSDEDADESKFGVEAAAVRPVETPEEKGLRELREYHQKVAQNGQIQNAADNFRDGHK